MLDNSEIEQLSDQELVKLTLVDQGCFAYLIMRYRAKLLNYIRRITNVRDEEAEDILQEVFLKTYLNLNSFKPSLKFSSWIYAIAHNQVISNFRKIKARPEGSSVTIDEGLAETLAADLNLEKAIDQKLLAQKIDKALQALPAKYREILILKYLEEKNYQEMSDIIKKPMGTVASMLNKARSEFKKVILETKILRYDE
jgi:RNA polymerase sigma-70 factor (ECF subfamily)